MRGTENMKARWSVWLLAGALVVSDIACVDLVDEVRGRLGLDEMPPPKESVAATPSAIPAAPSQAFEAKPSLAPSARSAGPANTATRAAAAHPAAATPASSPPRAPALGPVYYAETRDGWIEVTVPAKDSDGLFELGEALGGDVLWHGDRRTPAEIRELGPMHLLNAAAPTEARMFAALRPVTGMSEAWWILRFRRGKLAGPFLAVSDAPGAGVRLRKPAKARRTKLGDPMVSHLRKTLESEDAEALASGIAGRRVTCQVQTSAGAFPGATQVVAVSAIDSGDGDSEGDFFAAVFSIDDAGAVVQPIDAGRGAMQEVQAIGDIDGDGFDDLVVHGQESEGVSAKLVRLTPGHVDSRVLFSD